MAPPPSDLHDLFFAAPRESSRPRHAVRKCRARRTAGISRSTGFLFSLCAFLRHRFTRQVSRTFGSARSPEANSRLRDEIFGRCPNTNEEYCNSRVSSRCLHVVANSHVNCREFTPDFSRTCLVRKISRTPTAAFDCPRRTPYIGVDVPPVVLSPPLHPRVISSSAARVLSVPTLVTLSSGEFSSRPSAPGTASVDRSIGRSVFLSLSLCFRKDGRPLYLSWTISRSQGEMTRVAAFTTPVRHGHGVRVIAPRLLRRCLPVGCTFIYRESRSGCRSRQLQTAHGL